jgi:hypothetical protein
MIKAKLTNGDLLFGISTENVKRLKLGQPIVFNLKDMGLEDRKVMIMYGETEQDIMAELINEDHVDTTTKINRE